MLRVFQLFTYFRRLPLAAIQPVDRGAPIQKVTTVSMKALALTVIPLVLFAFGVATLADAQAPLANPSARRLAKSEESFVAGLMQDCIVEGRVATAARNRASRADVRDLGVMLEADYPLLAEELLLFAAKKSVSLPADLEATHLRSLDAISTVSVDKFDSAYLVLTIKNQARYVAQIEPVLANTNDLELKAILAKAHARVSEHLAQARSVQRKYASAN